MVDQSRWSSLHEIHGVKPHDLEPKSPMIKQSSLRFSGSRGESIQITFLHKSIARVRVLPKTCSEFLDRTWTVCGPTGKLNDCISGRAKDDFSDFEPLPQVDVKCTQDSYLLETSTLKLKVPTLSGSFSLSWYSKLENGEWSTDSFAADHIIEAYTYNDNGSAFHRMRRFQGDFYYGVGETSGYLNKSGRRFRIQCVDAMGYNAELSDPLYKHCPFVVCYNEKSELAYGLLYDHMTRCVLDLGNEISAFRGDYRYFESKTGYIEYYVIYGPTIPEVVEKMGRYLIGRPAVPPGWALGYLASSMTYTDAPNAEEELAKFCTKCSETAMPCTAFHLSSGYTMDDNENRNVFTWNLKRIPEPSNMFANFHKYGIKVIPNVKPWFLKSHPNYSKTAKCFLYDPLQQKSMEQYFWKGGAGTFTAGSYFDFTSKETFKFWKKNLKSTLLELGADAVWNDNNEYEVDSDNIQCSMDNSSSTCPIARCGRSLQTFLMGVSSYEALREHMPGKRVLNISRSGCMGLHRYCSQTWSGDNRTDFHTMKFNIPMALSVGLCGFVGAGADVGGFTGAMVTEELFLRYLMFSFPQIIDTLRRWIQLGIYFPRFSIHSSSWKAFTKQSALDKDHQNCTNEPWMFPAITNEIRGLLQFRASLITLLFSLHLEAAATNFPIMRPLVFHYAKDQNIRSREESFEFLLGRDLLIAGVFCKGDKREVYFPGASDERWCDFHTGKFYKGGDCAVVDAPLNGRNGGIPIFIRNNRGFVQNEQIFQGNQCFDQGVRSVLLVSDISEKPKNIEVSWYESDLQNDDSDITEIRVVASATETIITVQDLSVKGEDRTNLKQLRIRLHAAETRKLSCEDNIPHEKVSDTEIMLRIHGEKQ